MNNVIGQKLAKLRIENNMRQEDVARILAEISNDACHISSLCISSYENGKRTPPVTTLVYLCRVFDVSLDWLCGLSDNPATMAEASTDSSNEEELKPYKEIKLNELKRYDKQPVYIASVDDSISPGWAIVSYSSRRFIMADKAYTFASNIKVMSYPPREYLFNQSIKQHILNRSNIANAGNIWVEMISQDPFIQGQYNGWYHHNTNHSALVNDANSLVLKYEGLGISYTAYSQRP